MNEADQDAYEERAAILEYDHKLPRREAERRARKMLEKPAPLPPAKTGKNYTEFQAFWKNRNKF